MALTREEGRARYAEYLPEIRRRWQAEQAGWQTRRTAALEAARAAARVLYDRFGAKQVLAFGSVTRDGRFDDRSDIDLAVDGIARSDYLRAWSAIDTNAEFQIDLIDLDDCPPSIRERILAEGISL